MQITVLPPEFDIYRSPAYVRLKCEAEAAEEARMKVIREQAEEIERLRGVEEGLKGEVERMRKGIGGGGAALGGATADAGDGAAGRASGVGGDERSAGAEKKSESMIGSLTEQLHAAQQTIHMREERLVEFREEEKRLKGTIWDMKKELRTVRKQLKKVTA
jgi:predicted  nucleic acid-binding Zn-ribbon protein